MDRVIVQPTIDGGEFKIERWHVSPGLRVYVHEGAQTFYRAIDDPALWVAMFEENLTIVEFWITGLTYITLDRIGEGWYEFSDFNATTAARSIFVQLSPDVKRKLYNFIKYPPDPNLDTSWSGQDAFNTIRRAFPDAHAHAVHTFTTTVHLSKYNRYEILPAFGAWYYRHRFNLFKSRLLFKVAWFLMRIAAKHKNRSQL